MILYIGNNLKSKKNNVTTLQLLVKLLKQEGYEVLISSSKSNQVLRLLEMLCSIIIHRKKITYILIDTYSTKNFYYAFCTSQLARCLNLRYIPILHGGNLPFRLVNSPMMSRMIFANSYKNIAPSNYLKIAFENMKFQTLFIPNVLEIEHYKFTERRILEPKLLFVRAFSDIYNPKMAIYVLAEILKKFPLAKLCMVGPDKDGSLLECVELAKLLKVEKSVEFTGILTKSQWHEKSEEYDVFINTTNFDNTPVSVMEAMALGLPVVSTNVGGIPFLIDHNKTGVLVNPNAVTEMVDAIVALIEAEPATQKMILNARKKVESFDWSIVKQCWTDLLKE